MSPRTIKANVKVETFTDQTPESDKKNSDYTLEGEMAAAVTAAVLADFNTNQVFESVGKQFKNEPDLIMKGIIHHFYGRAFPAGIGWLIIPPSQILWLSGITIAKDYGEINLEISFERPNGTRLGTYYGQVNFLKYINWYQACGRGRLLLPRNTNKAFSAAIAQIREQILRDEKKLTRPYDISAAR